MEINTQHAKNHLSYLTRRWGELKGQAQFEIRCLKENNPTYNRKFTSQQIDAAVNFAAWGNKQGYNVYTTVNPIDMKATSQYASDKDIIGSFFCFADCDDTESMANVRANIKEGFTETFAVHTGKKPIRGHIYYELEQPTTDMQEWRQLQTAISRKFHSDEKIVNPSRIMRLAGFVSYPDTKKKSKGRVDELVQLLENKGVLKPIEALKKNFPIETTPEKFQINFMGYTQSERLDIENALRNIRNNIDWHDNTIKVVASMVSRGRTDQEIHDALIGITQPGYTQEQTDREVNIAIQGARNKGYDNNINNNQTAVVQPIDDEMFMRWKPIDPLTIKRKEFLYGRHYVRSYATLIIAPPGLGKSALVMVEAISMATGRALLGVETKKCKVAYFNAEDPLEETENRVLAIAQHYNIKQEELENLYISSGRQTEIILMTSRDEVIIQETIEGLERVIKREGIDVLILDPLQNLHLAAETNENFRTMGRALSMLADRCQCSICLVHHTRKISPGQAKIDAEDARGGSSLIGAVRSARVLNRMRKEDAENMGLDNHNDYFMIDTSKNNLARVDDRTDWHKKVEEVLPNGEEVVVVEKFTLPSVFDGVTEQQVRNLLKEIAATDVILLSSNRATRNQHKMSIHEFIAEQLGFEEGTGYTKKRVSSMVKAWLESDVLREETINLHDVDPKTYRRRDVSKHIVIGDTKI